jgi:maleylacetate reductase
MRKGGAGRSGGRVRAVIVRWGLDSLPGVLEELGIARPLLITSERWQAVDVPVQRRFAGVQPHAERAGVEAAAAAAEDADGLVALGGGSAIDTTKAVSVQRELPMVSVPTTYSGAEWTGGFGMRDAQARRKAGGAGAHLAAIVYEPELTLGLPAAESGGTALNALAHCAEALYVPNRSEESDRHALAGAALIARSLEPVLEDGADRAARTRLLEGAMHAGAALRAGMGVGHAMAQALGGRYGLPHGTMNAVCLPPALRFNREVAPDALARLGEAMQAPDPIQRVEQLAGRGGARPLREFDVPEEDLPELAAAAAERPPAKNNPRPAGPTEILALLRSVW